MYSLVGGNVRRPGADSPGDEMSMYIPGDSKNMFKFKGPRGVKVGCVLDEEEAEIGLPVGTDVAIVVGAVLGRVLDEDKGLDVSELQIVAVDEFDEFVTGGLVGETTTGEAIGRVLNSGGGDRMFNLLVGASVTPEVIKLAKNKDIIACEVEGG